MYRTLLVSLLLLVGTALRAEQRFRYYDHITFYDVYAGTVSNEAAPVPEGVERLNNSRFTTLLPRQDLERMGDTLRLELSITALCDNYDRIGSIDMVMMPKSVPHYNDCENHREDSSDPNATYLGRLGQTDPNIRRIEVARFITPFMNMNKGVDAPYQWDISFLSPMLHDTQLLDSVNLWLELHLEGVPYAANKEIAGCSGRNDVFQGTLDIVSNDVATTAGRWAGRTVTEPLVYERYVNRYNNTDETGNTVAHYTVHVAQPMADAMFLLTTSNHGANSGGEEYNRRLHYVWVNEWMASVYRPGRQSCEPFRHLNTQGNGIYGTSVKSDAAWQDFSNWCPGDVIDNRLIRLGAIDAGDYDFRLLVPDAVFTGNEGYFPFSLTFLGVREGTFLDLDIVEHRTPSAQVAWEDGQLTVRTADDRQIVHWTLTDAAGRRLTVQPGSVTTVPLHQRSQGLYVLVLLMDDGTVEAHKFFKQ